MANCPGCRQPALLDVALDDQGRSWHRGCFENHKRSINSLRPNRSESDVESLEHERDVLLHLIEGARKKPGQDGR